MKRLGLISCPVAALFACEVAFAADLAGQAPARTADPAPYDWSGAHVGGHFGYAVGRSQWSAADPALPGASFAGSVDLSKSFDMFKGTGSYVLGLQAGYDHVFASGLLLGAEADISAPNTIAGTRMLPPLLGTGSYGEKVLLSGTVRGRVGYAFDSWLAYGTAGLAWSYDRFTLSPHADAMANGEPNRDGADSVLAWRFGWAVGTGLEIPLSSNWTARAEYLLTRYGHTQVAFPAGQSFDSDLLMHSIRLGVNYRMGDDQEVADFFRKGVPALELERFAIHGQMTLTGQYALPFRSPYRGQNSLGSNQARETWDTTFYIGAKLWEGAELWVNPEIDQGFGLSGTFGVASFPSAEAYKVGSAYPYARLPRYFVRQTIDLGGESETVEGGFNQFAGKQSANRIVVTVGKFSSVDIFDGNKYSHDPRVDFLNWGLADTLTLDYAADAWAFTYGAAAEWYQGQWVLRAGLFDLPTVPNSTDLDPSFSQFQTLGEIEHRHELWGQPGKVAVTGFLNRARLGRFDEALRLAQATGTTPDLAAVRRYTSKSGVSVTGEQQVTAEIGLFARAGLSSPNLEANAFTDSDRTAAGGVSVSGRLWGRPDDTFRLAGILNHISASRIAYLDAGGLTAIIGDGRLPNPGLEKIIETNYSLPLFAWTLTLDYQLITNPAFNSDRGPVSTVAARLHTQF